MKIEAKGKKDGAQLTVSVFDDNGSISCLFNGEVNLPYLFELEEMIEADELLIGGTYKPKTIALKYRAALEMFFDRSPIIEASGITEEIPQPAGEYAIY